MGVNGSGFDHLTGLHDRSVLVMLNERFSVREGLWALVIIDIDHFKLVNDVYGHLAGDEILSHVGQTIRINLKRNDYAVRFGGDEFIIILPDTDGNCALDLAQRLLFELGSREFPGGLKISASLGIAQSKPEDNDISQLISMADQALYRAKETGRGRFVLADDLFIAREAEPDFSHMVGRREELQQLRELFDASTSDSARFCLLTGYQGSGKTKLTRELLNYCSFRNTPVYTTEVHPVNQEQNFMIINILRKALDDLSDEQLLSVKQAVGNLERTTTAQLAEFGFAEAPGHISSNEEEERARSRNDFGRILREISIIHPIVLIIDNLHWASGRCISFMAETFACVPDTRILYICISRDSKAVTPLKPVWTSIPSRRIHLSPLSKSDVRTMVFFAMKSPGIPGDVLNYMHRQSGGNALFLRKLISWCIALGYLRIGKGDICLWLEPDQKELPPEICSVIELMIDDCTEKEVKVLKRAALAGSFLDLGLLSELTSIDKYGLAEILDRFFEMGFIEDDGKHYSFSYGVMRSYLLSRISPSLRAILHEKTANFLENSGESRDDEHIEAIAHHYCNSGNKIKALEHSRTAAEKTFREGRHLESIHWYQEYLKIVSEEVDTPGFFRAHINTGILYSITGRSEQAEWHMMKALSLTDDPVDLCSVYYRLGQNCQRRSNYQKAIEHYEKAISIVNSIAPRSGVLINSMVGALLGSSFICRIQNRLREAEDHLSIAGEIISQAPDDFDKSLEGMYFARLADLESETGSSEKALAYYRTGLEICTRENDPAGEAVILNNMHDLYALSGDYNSMLDTLKRVIKLNNRLDDQLGLAIGYYNLAESYTHLNMLDLARRYFQLYIELNTKIENRLGMAYGQLGLGKLTMLKGGSRKAADYFRNASAIFDELQCADMKFDSDLERIKALYSIGDYNECQQILGTLETGSTPPRLESIQMHLKGMLLLHSTGNRHENTENAVALVEQSLMNTHEMNPYDIVYMYGNFAHALDLAGETERSDSALSKALEQLRQKLLHIKSDSIRKSILVRSDVMAFLNSCRKRELRIPF